MVSFVFHWNLLQSHNEGQTHGRTLSRLCLRSPGQTAWTSLKNTLSIEDKRVVTSYASPQDITGCWITVKLSWWMRFDLLFTLHTIGKQASGLSLDQMNAMLLGQPLMSPFIIHRRLLWDGGHTVINWTRCMSSLKTNTVNDTRAQQTCSH